LGIPPGPRYGDILRTVTAALLDGKATCRAEQLALAKRLAEGDVGLDWMPEATG